LKAHGLTGCGKSRENALPIGFALLQYIELEAIVEERRFSAA